MNEELTKAEHDLGFACDSLQTALDNADAITEIVVASLLRDAVALRDRISQLRQARDTVRVGSRKRISQESTAHRVY